MAASDWLRETLLGLPDVSARPDFGNEAFYVGGTMFAALTGRGLTMRLPAKDLTAALRAGQARPLVSMGAVGRNGWVEIRPDAVARPDLERLLGAAHAGARQAHGRTRPRHPTRARRRGPAGAPRTPD